MEHIYDVYEDRCPTRMVLDRIADKWALLILDKLRVDAVRFNLLRREIKGISQKVLSQTLKKLACRRQDHCREWPSGSGSCRE